MVRPLVQHCLGVAAEAPDTTDTMVGYAETGYEKTGSLDTDFSIVKTKELVSLVVVPMKSRGSDMVLEVMKVGSIVHYNMSMVEEIDY